MKKMIVTLATVSLIGACILFFLAQKRKSNDYTPTPAPIAAQSSAGEANQKPIAKEPLVQHETTATEKPTDKTNDTANTKPAMSAQGNIAKCAVYARSLADNPNKSEWAVSANKIKSECPGKGFECTTFNNQPEKNKCEPFDWDGQGSFFKHIKHDYPINSNHPNMNKRF